MAAGTTIRQATTGDAAEHAGRAGLIARGVMYCIAALLVLRVVFGGHERLDREGVLVALVRQPLGLIGVLALAVGFAAYAVWRFAEAMRTGSAGNASDERPGVGKRVAHAGHGLLYVVAVVVTVRMLLAGHVERANGLEREWTAELLHGSGGRIAVGAVALVLIALGAYLVWRGLSERFRRPIDEAQMTWWQRQFVRRLGIVGYGARGVVIAVVGWFVLRAAIEYDPKEAVGIDGALKRLLDAPYGRPALLVVAVGLLAFGLFSFAEARYRELLGDPTPGGAEDG